MEFFHRQEDPLNQVGYWGARTSAVDWCEANYTWSFYIAEFFNTITSLPAAFLAINSLYLTYKYGYGNRFFVINMLIAMVGIGSAAFHGSLLYTGQILDELPMVYTSLSVLYAVLEMESDKNNKRKYLAPALVAFAVVFTGVYLYLPDFFIFFVIAFILSILTLVYLLSKIFRKADTLTHQKAFILASMGFYIGGWLLFWIPEVLYCDRLQSFNFHSLWHVTSTLGAFVLVLFTVYQRQLVQGRRPKLCYNSFAGVPLLPYVYVPSDKEVEVIEKEEFRQAMALKNAQQSSFIDNSRRIKAKRSLVR